MVREKKTAEFIRAAIELAEENVRSGRGGPFGALVVRDGEIIGRGTNLVTGLNDPTAHAEVVAIREACRHLGHFELRGCEIYSSCEPCPMCFGAIYWARPAAVWFAATRQDAAAAGFDDAYIYEELALPPGQRTMPMQHLRHSRALEPFRLWRSSPNRIDY